MSRTAGPVGRLGGRYARLWAATTITNLADGVLLVVFPLAAVQLTRSPFLIAAANMAFTLPWFLFALFAGVLADRRDRRSLMLFAGSLRTLALVVLAAATGLGMLWLPVLYLGGLLLGSAETISETASQTLIPMVLDRDRLRQGNGYLQGTRIVMNDFAGIPLGGVLAGIAVSVAFAAPAALYATAVLVLLGLRGHYAPPLNEPGKPGKLGTEIRAGLSHLWKDPMLRGLGLLGAGVNLVLTGFLAVFVVFAVGPHSAMGLSGAQYGLLLGITGVGPLLGALLTDRLTRGSSPAMVLAVVLAGVAVGCAVPAFSAHPLAVGAGMLVSGTCGVVATVMIMALRQEYAPSHLLGRVTASFWLLSRGALPLGAFLSGALAEWIGLRPVFLVLAVIALALLPIAFRLRPHGPPPAKVEPTFPAT